MDEPQRRKEVSSYTDQFDNLTNNKELIDENLRGLLLRNINDLRQFHLQLSMISLVALGAAAAVLFSERLDSFVYTPFLYIAIFLFGLNSAVSVYYINAILRRENYHLISARKQYRDNFEKEIVFMKESVEQGKIYSEYERGFLQRAQGYAKEEREGRDHRKLDPYSSILTWLFIAGVATTLCSFIYTPLINLADWLPCLC